MLNRHLEEVGVVASSCEVLYYLISFGATHAQRIKDSILSRIQIVPDAEKLQCMQAIRLLTQ